MKMLKMLRGPEPLNSAADLTVRNGVCWPLGALAAITPPFTAQIGPERRLVEVMEATPTYRLFLLLVSPCWLLQRRHPLASLEMTLLSPPPNPLYEEKSFNMTWLSISLADKGNNNQHGKYQDHERLTCLHIEAQKIACLSRLLASR